MKIARIRTDGRVACALVEDEAFRVHNVRLAILPAR